TVAGTLGGFAAVDWPVSTGWSSSDSSALACATHLLGSAHAVFTACGWARPNRRSRATTGDAPLGTSAARGVESNTTRRNADPAGVRMCLRPWIILRALPSNF